MTLIRRMKREAGWLFAKGMSALFLGPSALICAHLLFIVHPVLSILLGLSGCAAIGLAWSWLREATRLFNRIDDEEITQIRIPIFPARRLAPRVRIHTTSPLPRAAAGKTHH